MAQPEHRGMAVAGSVLAATMLVVTGVFQAIIGVVAIAKNEFYVTVRNYLFDLDTTAWGWIHLVLGALLVLTGCFLFAGAGWAAVTGIGLAALSAINNFFFLPHYPLWSILVIAADVFVIWALATMVNSRTSSGRDAWQPGGGGADRWPGTNAPGTGRASANDAARAARERTNP